MKITIERGKFLNALNIVKDVVGIAELSILHNVKMECIDGDKLKLTASNLDQTISTDVKCTIEEKGDITVPAKLLIQMVGAMTSPMVEFKHDGKTGKAVLTGGDVTYKICTLPVAEFPKAADINGKKIEFTQSEFKEMLRKSSYASSQDTTRKTLVSVCFQTKDGYASMVATDGRRLACKKIAKEVENGLEIIIPTSTVKMLLRLLGNDGNISVELESGKSAKFTTDVWTVQTKLIDEKYPNWRQVIPANLDKHITIDRNTFIDSVKQVSLASDQQTICISMLIKSGVIMMSATTQDVSDAVAMIPVKYDGEEVKVNLNPYYVADVLNAFDDDEVVFNFKNGFTPVTFTVEGSEAIAVVMPLRVN